MKKIVIVMLLAISASVSFAATNVVTYTAEQTVAREKRIAEWRETWAKMTPEQREAHREEQKRKIAEARAKATKKEVRREVGKDGSITVTYDDGTAVLYKFQSK